MTWWQLHFCDIRPVSSSWQSSRPPVYHRRCLWPWLGGDDGCFCHLGENLPTYTHCMNCISTWLTLAETWFPCRIPPDRFDPSFLSLWTRRALRPYPNKMVDNILIPNVNVVEAAADKQTVGQIVADVALCLNNRQTSKTKEVWERERRDRAGYRWKDGGINTDRERWNMNNDF